MEQCSVMLFWTNVGTTYDQRMMSESPQVASSMVSLLGATL